MKSTIGHKYTKSGNCFRKSRLRVIYSAPMMEPNTHILRSTGQREGTAEKALHIPIPQDDIVPGPSCGLVYDGQ